MSSKSGPEAAGAARPPAPPRRPRSLAARLTWWYAASLSTVLVVTMACLYWALAVSVRHETSEFVVEEVRVLRAIIAGGAERAEALRFEVEQEWAEPRQAPVYARLLDASGATLMETPGMAGLLPPAIFPAPIPADHDPVELVSLRTPDGAAFGAVAAGAAPAPGGAPRIIQIAISTASDDRVLAAYRWRSALLLGVAFLFSVAVGRRIARRGLKRVREIADAARQVGLPTLHHRIDPSGLPAELSSLATTFNGMLDRLEASFTRLSRFSSDIAHEIRTPVNNIRGEAEVALARPRTAAEYRDVLESCLEECSRLTRLIDALLFLGRAETSETRVLRDPVDVGEEIARVREFYEAAAAEAGIVMAGGVSGRLDARLNRTLLQRAVGNLVENALAHTPRGGTVGIRAWREAGAVQVEVDDDGSGIPPEHLPHVFERFYRADRFRGPSAGGVGLGLAIVKAIAELHGGTVTIASEVGRGTRVRLTFPAEDDGILMSA
ncbi:MAG TPA: heavy metal sensor histidine kinase [Dongiaceae bacterium]|nr:heavy metal sensor histidine kinase [Dongiaceae bacterium]